MKIAVDFDGTIVEHRYPEIGKEFPFAIDVLKRLVQEHHQVILWTAREGHLLEEAVEFCRSRGLEFYAVNSEFPQANWASYRPTRKPRADRYIDDRALGGLPGWDIIYEMISENLTYSEVIKAVADESGKSPESFWPPSRR